MIGQYLKQARQECELSQPEVAKKLRISQSYISMIETGRKVPTSKFIDRLADLYDDDSLVGRYNEYVKSTFYKGSYGRKDT